MRNLADGRSEDERAAGPTPSGLEQPIRPRAHWCRPPPECVKEDTFVTSAGKRLPEDVERETRCFPPAQLRNRTLEASKLTTGPG